MKLSEASPIVSIAEQISEVIIAGFLWLIACIPIITIGPASAALYYTIVKVVRKKHSTVTIAFWHSFKENLKQGIGITLFYLVYAVILSIIEHSSPSDESVGDECSFFLVMNVFPFLFFDSLLLNVLF